MAQFKPGPYNLQFPVIQNQMSHVIEFNVDILGTATPGTPAEEIMMRTKGSTEVLLSMAANTLWGKIRGFLPTTSLCGTYTLFKRNQRTLERDFVSGGSLTTPNGAAGAVIPASYFIGTWRSAAGSVLRVYLPEVNFYDGQRTPIVGNTASDVVALDAYLISAASIVMARDRSFAVQGINWCSGQNEKTFNRRFRA